MPRYRIAAALAVLLLACSCGFRLQNATGVGGGGDTYRVSAVFAGVSRLPAGGTVRIGQLTVGTVASIETRDFRAIVHMDIDAGTQLPAGTGARLELTSALGEEQVVLEPPADPVPARPLGDSAVIPIERTGRGPEVEDALAAVGALVGGAGIDQVRTIVGELTTALGGRERRARNLLGELDATLASLDRHKGEITAMIDSLHTLSARLAEDRSTMEAAFTQIRPAIDVLLSQRESFTTLLDSVAALGEAAGGLLDRTGSALTEQLRTLRPVLADLRGIDGRLGATLASLHEFDGLLRAAVPGDYLMLDGTLDVPHTVAEVLTPDVSGPQPGTGGAGALLEGGTR